MHYPELAGASIDASRLNRCDFDPVTSLVTQEFPQTIRSHRAEPPHELTDTLEILMTIQPIGLIAAYVGSNAPKGWLMCNGKPIPKEFETLRKLVGDNTPDLRGYFLRGLDDTGAVDPDKRAILSQQNDGVGPHTHQYNHWFHGGAGKSGGDSTAVAGNADNPQTAGPVPSANETRPKNKAVNYIIKASDDG